MAKYKDLTGIQFGKLKVLNREPNKNKRTMWKCLCECGNEKVIVGYSLTTGATKSCGNCNKSNNIPKSLNKFDLSGEYGIGYTRKNEIFLFDLEDYNIIKNYTWYMQDGYVKSTIYNSISKNPKTIYMHRLVMNISDRSIFVDHISHNTYDNRKSQLRLVTPMQNNQNAKPKKNRLCNGVYWYERLKKWESLIGVNGKIIYIGLFDNYDDAVQARKDAETKYYGEYGYNHQND